MNVPTLSEDGLRQLRRQARRLEELIREAGEQPTLPPPAVVRPSESAMTLA